jgi:hypothetical protein
MKVITTLNGAAFLSQATRVATLASDPDWTSRRHFAAVFEDNVAEEFVKQLADHGTRAKAEDALSTLTPLAALQGAVEMLDHIKCGGSYNTVEYVERLAAYERALNAATAA